MRKSQTATINIFFKSTFLYRKNVYFVGKHIWENLLYNVTFLLQFLHVVGDWQCSNKTPTPIQIFNGLVDALL